MMDAAVRAQERVCRPIGAAHEQDTASDETGPQIGPEGTMESLAWLREWWRDRFPVMDARLGSEFREHVDAIEGEVAERYVDLPIDADGIPWHVGDMTENGNVVNGMTIDFHGWHFTGTRNDIDPAIHWHYVPKPTVEDVLRDYASRILIVGCIDEEDELVAEYAAKLRLAGDE